MMVPPMPVPGHAEGVRELERGARRALLARLSSAEDGDQQRRARGPCRARMAQASTARPTGKPSATPHERNPRPNQAQAELVHPTGPEPTETRAWIRNLRSRSPPPRQRGPGHPRAGPAVGDRERT